MKSRHLSVALVLLMLTGPAMADITPKHGTLTPDDRAKVVYGHELHMQRPEIPPPMPVDKEIADDGVSFIFRGGSDVSATQKEFEAVKQAVENVPSMGLEKAAKDAGFPNLILDMKKVSLTLEPVEFPHGKFLAALPTGAPTEKRTGIARIHEWDDGSFAQLEETDLASSNGMVYLQQDFINLEVHDKPATSLIMEDDDGLRLEKVSWVEGPIKYEIVLVRKSKAAQKSQANRAGTSTPPSAIELARSLKAQSK